MINEKIIVQKMKEDLLSMQQTLDSYAKATNLADERKYWNDYLNACSSYNARYETILLFGYDIVKDENNNIVGLENIYEYEEWQI